MTRRKVENFASYSHEKLSNGRQSAKFEVLQNFEIRFFSGSLWASKGVLSFLFAHLRPRYEGYENLPILVSRKRQYIHMCRMLERDDYSGKKSSYQQGGNRQYLRRYTRSQIRAVSMGIYGEHGYLCVFMSLYGCLWVFLSVYECHGCLWVSMGADECWWSVYGYLWVFIGVRGFVWVYLNLWYLSISIWVHGCHEYL